MAACSDAWLDEYQRYRQVALIRDHSDARNGGEGSRHVRMRVSDYRVDHDVDDGTVTVRVIRIRHRKDA